MKTALKFLWAPTTTAINALVFYILWHWFLIQAPLNLPPITYPHAVGISTIVAFLTNLNSSTTMAANRMLTPNHTADDLFWHSVTHCLGLWILSLGIGGIAYWSM